ncbi:2-dehydropantoate 2-reductase N-terminal domain-containing protein, partial [Shinella sp.]
MSISRKIAVVGAGAFGTALASVAAASGGDVTLIGRDAVSVEA